MGEVVKLPQPDNWENLLELFLFEKKAEGKAPRTISDYKFHVSNFFKRFPDALRSDKELRTSVLKYFSDDIKPATFNPVSYTHLDVYKRQVLDNNFISTHG